MEQSLSIFSFKRFKNVPKSLSLVLIFLLFSEFSVRQHAIDIITPMDEVIIHKAEILKAKKPLDHDIIILGDSRSLSIDPSLIADYLGSKNDEDISIYNFSIPNSGNRFFYLFLKKYLSVNKAPKAILFESIPLGVTGNWNIVKATNKNQHRELHRLFYLFNFSEYISVFPLYYLPKLIAVRVEEFSILLSYRLRIRDIVGTNARNIDDKVNSKVSIDKNGRMVFVKDKVVSEKEVKDAFAYKTEFKVDDQTVDWYRKFFDLAEKHNIKIYMFNSPVLKEIYDYRNKTGFNQEYARFFDQLASEYKNVTLLQPILEGYEREYFFDASHLNNKGGQKFSKVLGERFSRYYILKGEKGQKKSN